MPCNWSPDAYCSVWALCNCPTLSTPELGAIGPPATPHKNIDTQLHKTRISAVVHFKTYPVIPVAAMIITLTPALFIIKAHLVIGWGSLGLALFVETVTSSKTTPEYSGQVKTPSHPEGKSRSASRPDNNLETNAA